MRGTSRVLSAVVAIVAALSIAGTASAAQTATIGSTSGTPSQNIGCAGPCTYAPFNNVSSPELVVPFDGTVTSFSLNSGSMSATPVVSLRVLRPAGGGKSTGAGTSPAQTLNNGLNTYTVTLPVKKGDVLGLDNGSSAILFDVSSTTPITAYYQLPPLADGSTRAPTNTQTGYRLLLSAVVQAAPGTPPKISGARLTHKRFRLAKAKSPVSAKAPRGTAFKFTLSTAANVQIAIARLMPGLRKGGRCVKPTRKLRNAHAKRCVRSLRVGKLTRANLAQGAKTIKFTGRIGNKALKPGRYSATLTARNTAGRSKAVTLRFRIVRR
jgi:hypothetical protein